MVMIIYFVLEAPTESEMETCDYWTNVERKKIFPSKYIIEKMREFNRDTSRF